MSLSNSFHLMVVLMRLLTNLSLLLIKVLLDSLETISRNLHVKDNRGNRYKTSVKEFYEVFLYFYACLSRDETHAKSINSDLQRGLDRRLQHT